MRTAIEIADGVRRGELRALDVVNECLARISERNPSLGAFVHIDPNAALAAARAIDEQVAAGTDPGPLAGVPFGVKDLEDCAGMPTRYGSTLYADAGPAERDSVHVARLRAAGAIPVGKTATPEFGLVAFTRTKAHGITRNPWDPERTPGGSSGGSAAAVASGMVPLATASDAGGSTRIPASFSGLVGLKPSFGRIPCPEQPPSRVMCYGALTTTVADTARYLDVVSGPDDRDRTSLPAPEGSYEDALGDLAVGGSAVWSSDLGFAVVDRETQKIAHTAAEQLCPAAGVRLSHAPFTLVENPVQVWTSATAADPWTFLEDGMWPGCIEEVNRYARHVLEATEQITLPLYVHHLERLRRLCEEVDALFRDVDVLMTPTTAVPAFAANGPPPKEIAGKRIDPMMAVPFTMLANLTWHPAISIPAGRTQKGLPVGVQVICRRHRDDIALRLARALERTRPWPQVAEGSAPPSG